MDSYFRTNSRLSTVIVAARPRKILHLPPLDTAKPSTTEYPRLVINQPPTLSSLPTLYHHRFSVCLEPTPLQPTNQPTPKSLPEQKHPKIPSFTSTIFINIFTILRTFIYLSFRSRSGSSLSTMLMYVSLEILLFSSDRSTTSFVRWGKEGLWKARDNGNRKEERKKERKQRTVEIGFEFSRFFVRIDVNLAGMGRGWVARTWTHAFIFPSTET